MEKKFVSVADIWGKGVAIPNIVSGVEEEGVYYFDRFGRYKKADPASCLNGLEFLWDWKNGGYGPTVNPETEEIIFDPSLQLDDFGWYEQDLPKFGGTDLRPKTVPQEQISVNMLVKVIAALLDQLNVDWRTCSAAELVRTTEFSGSALWSNSTAAKYQKMMKDIVD